MADDPRPQPPAPPTALDHAAAMLDHLRLQRPGDGHDLARAMLASAGCYLVEAFGREHALQTASDLLRPLLGTAEASEAVPGEGATSSAAPPAITVH